MQDIQSLVGSSTEEQRAELLDDMMARLAAHAGSLPAETATFCYSVIMHLLKSAEAHERSEMAMKLARAPGMPTELLAALAVSEIAIAAPVLTYAAPLTKHTLVEVARECSESHVLAVTQRNDLDGEICEAVLERGSVDIAIALTNNPDAHFTTHSVEMLGELTAESRELEERLCGRLDLPDAVSHRLMQAVSMRLQVEMGQAASNLPPDVLRLALRTRAAEVSAEATDRIALSQASIVEVMRLNSKGELDEAKLQQFIADGQLEMAACAFAKLADLKPAIARRVLLATGSETLAVAARAIPLETETYIALAKLVSREGNMSEEEEQALFRQYESLPVRVARQVMLFHKKRRRLRANERSEHSRPHDVALAARVAN